jgi:cysteinyl-tRNA synthetase
MHYHFLQVEGQKMSKSLGNFFTIEDITKRGIHPLAFRLLLLQSHYRQPMNFTWVSAESANEAYKKLKIQVALLKSQSNEANKTTKNALLQFFKDQFNEAISNDLQTPQAIATLFTMLKSELNPLEKLSLVADFDKVFALQLLVDDVKATVPAEITALAEERVEAKKAKEYAKADELRKTIEAKGYIIKDSKEGFTIDRV